jgi:hypothetical protein
MPYLDFIDDQTLEGIVRTVLQKGYAAQEKTDKTFGKNVIDPFSMLFEMGSFSISDKQWFENEKIRQAQKTLSNHVGTFHQSILGAIEGWESLKVGGIVDVICHSKEIIAEVKNKHNTIKASDQSGMYDRLEKLVMDKGQKYKDYTAYYVEIIPRKPKPYDDPFMPSKAERGQKCQENQLIRVTDGYSFYKLATGIDDALYQLFSVLPEVIAKIKPECKIKDTKTAEEFFRKAYYP